MPDQPTPEQIDDQLNLAARSEAEGRSQWPGMTYEQGVSAALRWATGQSDEVPMEE